MHNSFLIFDFGANEESAQQARHKLEGWKQAFRLDKKLLYKFDRQQPADSPAGDSTQPKEGAAPEKPAKGAKSKSGKASPPAKNAKSKEEASAKSEAPPAGDVKLLVRLYFSGHEKLSYQRWVDRIPAEEPFKAVRHEVVASTDARYAELDQRFESLD